MDNFPTWDWSPAGDATGNQQPPSSTSDGAPPKESSRPEPCAPPKTKKKRYGPRTCRICLETEEPKFPSETNMPFGLGASSRPTYVSDDPELGRLLSPCKCKGSQKYVHEGCLTAWRKSSPTQTRNYWQCPTCQFTYRMVRLNWSSALSSRWARIALTAFILLLTIFVLGFIADPIFDLWSDPVGTIGETITSVVNDIEAKKPPPYEPPTTWYEHLIKGFFSFGIIGMLKSMLAMGPWDWYWIRRNGIANTGRRQGTGRGRVENISVLFVLIGAFTFMMAVWKFVQAWSVRVLKNVSERVLDVNGDDDDEDEDDEDEDQDDVSREGKKEQ